jgi:hypothetical protein
MKGIKVLNRGFLIIPLFVGILFFFINWKSEKKSLKPMEYVQWISDMHNGLRVEKKMDNVSFYVQYEPANYVVANIYKDAYLKTSVLNSEKKKYSDLQYYSIQICSLIPNSDILSLKLKNKDDYYTRENYYSYDFEKDVFLVDGEDTLGCCLFNYAPNYGISPHIDFLVAFKKNKDESESDKILNSKRIIIYDKIMGYGVLWFEISKRDINNIPDIITY